MKDVYNASDLQNHPYELQSIVLEDEGKYSALIYDNFQKKWRKYNDQHVSDITEE